MKKFLTVFLCIVLLTGMFACAKDDGGKNSDPDALSSYGEKGAEASGNKLNELLKEKKESDKTDEDSDNRKDPIKNEDSGKTDTAEGTAGSEDNDDGAEVHFVIAGKYAEALSEDEVEETLRIALDYAKEKYSDTVESSDLEIADDDCGKYEDYPLYNRGNIIIYTCKVDGKTHYITVARLNSDADWQVLTKKTN